MPGGRNTRAVASRRHPPGGRQFDTDGDGDLDKRELTISGPTVTEIPGAALGDRVRTYWYEELESACENSRAATPLASLAFMRDRAERVRVDRSHLPPVTAAGGAVIKVSRTRRGWVFSRSARSRNTPA